MKTSHTSRESRVSICPRTGRPVAAGSKARWAAWLLPVAGLLSLAWFLLRVIPKPSRAAYPCQRLAFPIASGFVAWLVGLVATVVAYRKVKQFARQHRAGLAVACAVVVVIAGLHTLFNVPASPAAAYTVPQTLNTPVGVAKGINPGRVVWVHDPRACQWSGSGYYWLPANNNQPAVDNMMSLAIRTVAGESTDEAAWDAIFCYYNNTHDRGDVGYTTGEKIAVKCNLVPSEDWNDGRVNLTTYVQTAYADCVSVSPYMMLSLLRQLVYKAGVPQEDITIGDTLCFFVSQHWDACHTEFPNVKYIDPRGLCGRTKTLPSDHPFYWSNGAVTANQDYVPQMFAEATYFINFANLKAHEGGGGSLCGKNNYGSLGRRPSDAGYYELHGDLAFADGNPLMGQYRTLTDFLAHPDFGGKGLLYMLDGLWSATDANTWPVKWNIPPFNNDYPKSLVVSQDPVAIDSVGLDALKAAMPTWYPGSVTAADDYLHEAALLDDPPSGTMYDPDHSGVPRASVGVHEHWNNNTDRQYSRNLGTGDGIELLWFNVGDPGDADRDKAVDTDDVLAVAGGFGKARGQTGFVQNTDLTFDGRIDVSDLLQVANNFGNTYP
jgi:hypothetical protein